MTKIDVVRHILSYARRIAVVGLSDRPTRSSYDVAAALQRRGYEIVPVNPNVTEVLGEQAYPTLADVPGKIDVVDVFRREEHLEDIAQQVVDRGGVRALWLQLGLHSPEARHLAAHNDLDYIEDRCLKIDVAAASAGMQLPPDPS